MSKQIKNTATTPVATAWSKAYAETKAAVVNDVAQPWQGSRVKQVGIVAGLVGAGIAIHAALS